MGEGGLFRPAKHKHLADVVTFESVSGAKKAANELLSEARKAKTAKAARLRAQALQLAANRAKASLHRKDLKPETRKRLRRIAEIYDEAADKAWEIYEEKKRSKKRKKRKKKRGKR